MWSSIFRWILPGCLLMFLLLAKAENLDYSWATPSKPNLSDRSRLSFNCLNPNYRTGHCVPITECPELMSRLQNQPLSSQSKEFLKHSLCRYYEDQDPVVCCLSPNRGENATEGSRPEPTPIKTTQTTSRTETSTRPTTRPTTSTVGIGGSDALSNHPNARLLPSMDKCGVDHTQSRIYGGKEAQLGEFSWMALLKYLVGKREGFYCGGALISKRYVLTAAHCVKIDGLKLIAVRVGEHDVTTDPDCKTIKANGQVICAHNVQDIPVEEEIPHPNYIRNERHHYNDIALIRLRSQPIFNDYVQAICLPFGNEDTPDLANRKMWTAGWGQTERRGSSDVKLKVNVSVTEYTKCADVYSEHVNIDYTRQTCAGGETGEDSCNGDSGGPLMESKLGNDGPRWYLQGVVAFGPSPCGTTGWPGIYTKASFYLPWILDNIRP